MHFRFMLLALLVLLLNPLGARIPASFVIDAKSGHVYHAQNADREVHPASLTKMMTLYMLFDAIDRGALKLTSCIRFSRRAANKPRSRLGVRPGQSITVKEAIKAMVVRSANDVATAVGEHLGGGSEIRFARMMTKKAHSLGMRRTQFKNASGLPNRYQHTTARDMATLGVALRRDFPRLFPFFSTRTLTYKGHTMGTTNKLLGRVKGVDGIKTGYINASGFNLTTSVKYNDHQLVAVVIGGSTGRARDMKMRTLLTRTFCKVDKTTTPLYTFGRGKNTPTSGKPKMSPLMLAKRQKTQDVSAKLAAAKPLRKSITLASHHVAKKKPSQTPHWQVRMGKGANRSCALELAQTVRPTLRKALGFTPKVHVTTKKRGRTHPQLFALTRNQARSACRALKRRNVPCIARNG